MHSSLAYIRVYLNNAGQMQDDVQAPRRNDPEESQKEAAGERIKGRPAVRFIGRKAGWRSFAPVSWREAPPDDDHQNAGGPDRRGHVDRGLCLNPLMKDQRR